MREVLFRGKKKYSGEWIKGYYLKIGSIGVITRGSGIFEPIIPETRSEFTGLTDRNGTKIFEGDILKTQYGEICVMKWYKTECYGGWGLSLVNTNHKRSLDCNQYNCDHLEIIGNIHDNPEMLTE